MKIIREHQEFLQTLIKNYPFLTAFFYITFFFLSTLSALPITLALVAIGGFLFGPFAGSIYALIATMCSSIATFSAIRKMFGVHLQKKYHTPLKKFNRAFSKYGFYYLVAVRTIPVVPFFIVNVGAGLTQISIKKFIIATLIGELPIIIICAYLGSQCGSFIVNW